MSHLSLKDIRECYQNNRKLTWHEEYDRQAWKDGPAPLTITGVSEIDILVDKSTVRCGFIKYKCSNPDCRLCTDETLVLQGHHKIIKPDGIDPSGKVIIKETKKRTITNIVDQPVFREYVDDLP